jgi:hypothetical protein
MKRASSIHNSICNLLLIAYENLQEHIKLIRNLLPIDKQFVFSKLNVLIFKFSIDFLNKKKNNFLKIQLIVKKSIKIYVKLLTIVQIQKH